MEYRSTVDRSNIRLENIIASSFDDVYRVFYSLPVKGGGVIMKLLPVSGGGGGNSEIITCKWGGG